MSKEISFQSSDDDYDKAWEKQRRMVMETEKQRRMIMETEKQDLQQEFSKIEICVGSREDECDDEDEYDKAWEKQRRMIMETEKQDLQQEFPKIEICVGSREDECNNKDEETTRHRNENAPSEEIHQKVENRQMSRIKTLVGNIVSSDDEYDADQRNGDSQKFMATTRKLPVENNSMAKLKRLVRNESIQSSDDEYDADQRNGDSQKFMATTRKLPVANKSMAKLKRLVRNESIKSSDDELDAYFGVKADRAQIKRLSNVSDLPPLFTGGKDFNWYKYGLKCLGFIPPCEPEKWISRISADIEVNRHVDLSSSVRVNMLFANPMQRIAIAINLERLLKFKKGILSADEKPLRLLVQGSAGVGKTFVIKGITHVARRLFKDGDSVMNLAPTGTASVLLPQGRTVNSVTPIPRNRKISRHCKLSDLPLPDESLNKLRDLTGSHDVTLKLKCINLDERSQYSKRDLGWSNQRFNDALGCHKSTFGSVPIVNFFGDLGQLGPTRDDKADLHLPCANDYEESVAGYDVYRAFNKAVILSQTMRQAPDQIKFRDLLLRIRNGTATEEDWVDINKRAEEDLSEEERRNFNHDRVITIMETWAEVNQENHRKLAEKSSIPVAVVRSSGSGRHHNLTYKQCGQIVYESLIAVGTRVFLTKDQKGLSNHGLNHGAMGKVIAILYDVNIAPPEFPTVVVVEFPGYTGPHWLAQHPNWVPIPVDEGNCDANCCQRKGFPLMPGYAIPVFESQGMTIGAGQPATHCRIKFEANNIEKLGTTYTALSRVDCYDKWMLVEKIPHERIDYINSNPVMDARKQEEMRLEELASETLDEFGHYAEIEDFVELLHELDECCKDGLKDAECSVDSSDCKCMLCKG